jgi:hypothetical protein
MPITNETLNNNLYDNLYSQGYNPDPLDSIGKESEIEDADVFRLKYKDKDKTEKNCWMAIVDRELILWADNSFINLPTFENFNKFWKKWAQQQTLGWKVTNRDRLVSDMKKRTAMKKKEDHLNEGYYALGKQRSYNDSIPTVKLLIQHTRQLEEGEQRFRNIAKIFVENAGGERFLLPTNRPGLARVFARHIAEGGTPYDDKGRHITSLVEEYTQMAGFVRATRNGQFNESALRLVNEGLLHYNNLRMTLQGMTSHRGYNNYFESYTPVLNEETDDDVSLNELFVEETLDPRIESVMPILKRLSKNINEMNEVKELDEWAKSITEVEDETTKTLAEPAVDMLDEDDIDDSMKEVDSAASTIKEAPGAETLKHNQNTEKSNLKAFDLAEEDVEEGVVDTLKKVGKKVADYIAPSDEQLLKDLQKRMGIPKHAQHGKPNMAKPNEEVEESGLQAYLGKKKYGEKGMKALQKAGREGADKEEMAKLRAKFDKLDEVEMEEGLDANQKRVGQLGPTEPVGKNEKNLRGKLVGASESVELSEMDKSQPSSDRGGESSGDPYAKGGKGTPIKADKAKKDFLGVLQKSVDKHNKAKQDTDKKVAQHMKEGQDDLDAILRIIRK